jgi:CHAP domain-containing protein
MRILLLILLPFQIYGQSDVILRYVDKHLGQKVGSGRCYDLVDEAYSKVNRHWKGFGVNNYGILVDSSEVKPGDVVFLTEMVRFDGKKLPDHVAIVYKIEGGKIIVAEQTAGEPVFIQPLSNGRNSEYLSQMTMRFYRLQ